MPPKRQRQRRHGDDRDREIPRYNCRTGKTGWDHRRGAESALRDAERRGGLKTKGAPSNEIRAAYRCPECGGWHLTALGADESRAINRERRESRNGMARRDEARAACSAREWWVRNAAVLRAYGRESAAPTAGDLTTKASRHYARAYDLATDPDTREFWRAIEAGDLAARAARAIRADLTKPLDIEVGA